MRDAHDNLARGELIERQLLKTRDDLALLLMDTKCLKGFHSVASSFFCRRASQAMIPCTLSAMSFARYSSYSACDSLQPCARASSTHSSRMALPMACAASAREPNSSAKRTNSRI